MTGPTNPPQLPIELIRASPAAAPVPVRIEVGSDQNVPMAAKIPSVASDSASMTRGSGVPAFSGGVAPGDPFPNWGWVLAAGIVGILLAVYLWANLSVTSEILLGVL